MLPLFLNTPSLEFDALPVSGIALGSWLDDQGFESR
jgi:hypothetical protein